MNKSLICERSRCRRDTARFTVRSPGETHSWHDRIIFIIISNAKFAGKDTLVISRWGKTKACAVFWNPCCWKHPQMFRVIGREKGCVIIPPVLSKYRTSNIEHTLNAGPLIPLAAQGILRNMSSDCKDRVASVSASYVQQYCRAVFLTICVLCICFLIIILKVAI